MDRTPWNPEWSAAIERVRTLVECIFSCRVKFQTLDTFLDRDSHNAGMYLEQDLVFLESPLFEPPLMLRGTNPGAFAFPLRVRRAKAKRTDVSLVGVATIEGLAASSDDRLQQLGEFLQMVIESRIEAFERLLDVEQQERHFLEQSQIRENAKVIRLFPHAPAEAQPFQLDTYENKLDFSKPIVLFSTKKSTSNEFPFSRVALEIFNRTSLWFFVNMSDLSEDAFQSAQSFRNLGRMCIFIPDLAAVSIEKQLRLAEVFGTVANEESSTDTTDLPRLITVLHDTPATLVGSGAVLPHLLALLTPIELDQTLLEARETSTQTIRNVVLQIEEQLTGEKPVEVESTTKASNLIPLLGRWRQDDGSNPTFH